MRVGAMFGFEWIQDLGVARSAAQALEEEGFDFIGCGSHVVTEAPGLHPGLPDYASSYQYRDLLVLFTHLMEATTRVHYRTDLVILPLYPTAAIARQCADISDLSGGRLELGVGIGWNEVEYRALGQDFRTRAARYEEQLEVLRALWTEPRVTYNGTYHDLRDVGLGKPPAKPIPIHVGCAPRDRLLRRVARLADGWIPNVDPVPHVGTLRSYTREAGRPEDSVTITGRLGYGERIRPLATEGGNHQDQPAAEPGSYEDPAAWAAEAQRYREAGVTDIIIWPPTGSRPQAGLAALISARTAVAAAVS